MIKTGKPTLVPFPLITGWAIPLNQQALSWDYRVKSTSSRKYLHDHPLLRWGLIMQVVIPPAGYTHRAFQHLCFSEKVSNFDQNIFCHLSSCRWSEQRAAHEEESVTTASGSSPPTSPTSASHHQPQLLSKLHFLLLWAAAAPVSSLSCRTCQKPPTAFETDTLLRTA